MSLMAVMTMPCNWWPAWQGGHCARHQLGELDRLALRAGHDSTDPVATTRVPKGVHDNSNKKKNKCHLAVFFCFSSSHYDAKGVRDNAGQQDDGFMAAADSFFPLVNQKF